MEEEEEMRVQSTLAGRVNTNYYLLPLELPFPPLFMISLLNEVNAFSVNNKGKLSEGQPGQYSLYS